MERASLYLVTAFFFTFPLVFGGIPAFFGDELPRGIFLYEGIRLAWLVLWAGIFLAFLPIWRILRNPKFLLWNPNWHRKSVIAFGAAIGFFILAAFIHPSDPISDVLFGRTYSTVAVSSLILVASFLSTASREVRKSAFRAMVIGFVAFNLPYATAQVFGFDPVAARVTFPDW
jgi:hypothetical protein